MTKQVTTGSVKIKIEKGIPIPVTALKTSSGLSDALARCDVGDSFMCPKFKSRATVYSIARYRGIRVSVRREGSKIRVWRVK
jgi:hypothetical protein